LNASDADVGSSGLVLLPDQPGTYPHLLIGAGEQGVTYSVNRDDNGMGRNNGTSNQNIQSLAGLSSHGLFDYLGARPIGTAMYILPPGLTTCEPSRSPMGRLP
jgi:hypothetical protein